MLLQVFRALCQPLSSGDLSDVLSRLVETVAEQGEDMQVSVYLLLLPPSPYLGASFQSSRPLELCLFSLTPFSFISFLYYFIPLTAAVAE